MKIGIDLGGSHIAVGIVKEENKIIVKEEKNVLFINREQNEIKELITNEILSLINSLQQKLQIPAFIVEGIGVGVPGIIENNIIKKCEKYGIYNWDLARDLQKYFNANVNLINDAIAAARAEVKYGNLKNTDKSIFICIGTGIGGAIVISNESTASTVFSTTENSSAQNTVCTSTSYTIYPSEFGHMVIGNNGINCHCGRIGCFETYCSMRNFKNEIIELLELSKNTTSEELHDILKRETANESMKESLNMYLDKYTENLALGICNIINIVNPKKICIGGSFAFFADVLYDRLVSKIQTCNLQFKVPEVVLAKFQNDAGIIGAVL